MICHIDANNGVPIYEQIGRQVKFAVANGLLMIGEHVPSVRELATQLAVNPNTVARAYRELQQSGVLIPIRGTGLAIGPDAPARCRADRQEIIRDRAMSLVEETRRAGMLQEELLHLIRELWNEATASN